MMNATYSLNGGICSIGFGNELKFIDLALDQEVPIDNVHMKYNLLDDWNEISGKDEISIIEDLKIKYRINENIIDLGICLSRQLDKSLIIEILDDINSNLISNGSTQFISFLLKSKVDNKSDWDNIIEISLENGYIAVASCLSETINLQPLLASFLDKLSTHSNEFITEYKAIRIDIWDFITNKGLAKSLLLAKNKSDFNMIWLNYVDDLEIQKKKIFISIMNNLADDLYPSSKREIDSLIYSEHEIKEKSSNVDSPKKNKNIYTNNYDDYLRVKSQITKIIDLLEKGQDSSALKIVKQLNRYQRSTPDLALKTLCNISSQCTHIYRNDFAFKCLSRAQNIDPQDPWVNMQMAEYYKQDMKYDKAIEILEKLINQAIAEEHKIIALSSIANVFTQKREYAKSMSIYKNILDRTNNNCETVELAIADLYRKQGMLDKSLQQYYYYKDKYGSSDRVISGIAEIYKLMDKLKEARDTYEQLINSIQNRRKLLAEEKYSLFIFKTALAGIYKRENKLEKAYQLYDELLVQKPYAKHIFYLKKNLANLLGKEIENFDNSTFYFPEKFLSWKEKFFEGLLLLGSDKYSEAKNKILCNFDLSSLDEDSEISMRLGAVIISLYKLDNLSNIEKKIEMMPNLLDLQKKYLFYVLEYHFASLKNNRDRMILLVNKLKHVDDNKVLKIIDLIDEGSYKDAIKLEINYLMTLTA